VEVVILKIEISYGGMQETG